MAFYPEISGRSRRTILLAAFGVLALGGCTPFGAATTAWLEDWPPDRVNTADQPQAKLVQTADATWIDPNGNTPPVAKMVPDEQEAKKALDRRLSDLEDKVSAMNQNMAAIMPALDNLNATQSKMQTMITKLQTVPLQPAAANESPPRANPSPSATTTSPTAALPQEQQEPASQGAPTPLAPLSAAAPAAGEAAPAAPAATSAPVPADPGPGKAFSSAGGLAVSNIRFGEHDGKTRIVLDCSGTVAFSDQMAADNRSLTISLKSAGWSGKADKLPASSLVDSYHVESDGRGGAKMTISLKQSGSVAWAQSLPPASGGHPRIVIDIAKL